MSQNVPEFDETDIVTLEALDDMFAGGACRRALRHIQNLEAENARLRPLARIGQRAVDTEHRSPVRAGWDHGWNACLDRIIGEDA